MFDEEQLHRYIHACVTAQPKWLRQMFHEEQIRFAVDPSGFIILECRSEVEKKIQKKASASIAKYFKTFPVPVGICHEISPKSVN